MSAIKSPLGKLNKICSIIFLLGIVILWILCSSLMNKTLALICASIFSLIEYTWIGSTELLENGEVVFQPFSKNRRKPHTVFYDN
jgi:uncharacterized membrane protein YobD (UPF0266 family)